PQCPPTEGGGWSAKLTRSVRLAVLRMLRPAEAATRRLVVAMARPLLQEAVALENGRPLRPVGPPPPLRGRGSATTTLAPPGSSPVYGGGGPKGRRRMAPAPSPAPASFRMLDPPRSPARRRRWVRQTAMPRISVPGFSRPAPVAVRA